MMKLRRPGAWQRVLAIAPLLLAAVSLQSQVVLRCRMDGQVREACCCPGQKGEQPAVPAVSATCCCDREISEHRLPSIRTTPPNDSVPTLAVVLVPYPPLTSAGPTAAIRSFRQSSPAREGPRILLLKQAFLI
jgi:hypothetical protein